MSRFPGFDVASSESEKQSLLSRYAFESMYPALSSLEAVIKNGFPADFDFMVEWVCDPKAPFEERYVFVSLLDRKGRAEVTFGLSSPEIMFPTLSAGYLILHKDFQKKGIGTKLAGLMFSFADNHKIDYVKTSANLDVGCYSWAAMGARPSEPSEVKQQLLNRIGKLVQDRHWPLSIASQFRDYIRTTNDPDFMLNLAYFVPEVAAPQRNYAKELLSGALLGDWNWKAYWDLNDPFQRQVLEDLIEKG